MEGRHLYATVTKAGLTLRNAFKPSGGMFNEAFRTPLRTAAGAYSYDAQSLTNGAVFPARGITRDLFLLPIFNALSRSARSQSRSSSA